MTTEIRKGARVRLLGLPEWLTHDLPVDEQQEMRAFVGRCAVVSEVDSHGYFWLGFGSTVEGESSAHYSGHSFAVPREFIEPAPE